MLVESVVLPNAAVLECVFHLVKHQLIFINVSSHCCFSAPDRLICTLRLRRNGHVIALPILMTNYVDRYVVATALVVPTVVLSLIQVSRHAQSVR